MIDFSETACLADVRVGSMVLKKVSCFSANRDSVCTIADDGADAEVQVIEPTGSEAQVVAKMGGEDIIAVFRERHQFRPGDRIRLRPDPRLVHLFDQAAGKRLNA
jgi:ABC-type sugar transport system ATPase subunit